MNKFIKINSEDRNRVVELIEQDKNIDFKVHESIDDMIKLENNYHVSECGNYILGESRVFEKDTEQLITSDLQVIKIEEGVASIYQDETTLNDVWEFTDWKQINR